MKSETTVTDFRRVRPLQDFRGNEAQKRLESGARVESLVKHVREFLAVMARVRGSMGGPNIEQWLLDHGTAYVVAPWTPTEAASINLLTTVITPKKKACYANAQTAVLTDTAFPLDLRYAEGYAMSTDLFPMSHAWLLLNGKVWDPTWDLLAPRAAGYFGVTYDTEEVRRRVVAREAYGSLIYDPMNFEEVT